jgi:hypothetical protein
MSAVSEPAPPSLRRRLAERESRFQAPAALVPLLDRVRDYLREELPENAADSLPLAKAALVLASATEGDAPTARWVPLAAGMEMIYFSLAAQHEAVSASASADLFGLLSHDLLLARALDLYTRDGDCRVMEAVSQGAASLCESLMKEHCPDLSTESTRRIAPYLRACIRVGAGVGNVSSAAEAGMIADAEALLSLPLNSSQERTRLQTNLNDGDYLSLRKVLSCWKSAPSSAEGLLR